MALVVVCALWKPLPVYIPPPRQRSTRIATWLSARGILEILSTPVPAFHVAWSLVRTVLLIFFGIVMAVVAGLSKPAALEWLPVHEQLSEADAPVVSLIIAFVLSFYDDSRAIRLAWVGFQVHLQLKPGHPSAIA